MNVLHLVADQNISQLAIQQLCELHIELIRQNHNVSLVHPTAGSRFIKNIYSSAQEVQLISMPAVLPDEKFSTISQWRFLRKTLRSKDFDVVNIDVDLLLKTHVAMLGNSTPITVNLPSNFQFTLKTRFLLRLKRILRIIVPSEDDRDYAMESGRLDGHMVDVVYDGFFEGHTSKKNSHCRAARVGITNDAFSIGVGSDNGDLCCLDSTITAFDHVSVNHPNAYLVLAGISRADLRTKNIHLTAEQLQRIRFIDGGGLSHGDFSLFDLFLVISRSSRGIPQLVKEVIAHRTPLIAIDSPGNRELVNHMKSGLLVPVDDIDEIYKMMSFAIQHPEQVASMARKARASIKRQMSHTTRVQQIIEIYLSVINSKPMHTADTALPNI